MLKLRKIKILFSNDMVLYIKSTKGKLLESIVKLLIILELFLNII